MEEEPGTAGENTPSIDCDDAGRRAASAVVGDVDDLGDAGVGQEARRSSMSARPSRSQIMAVDSSEMSRRGERASSLA